MVAHHCGGVHTPGLITPELVTRSHADVTPPGATESPSIEMAPGNDSAAERESKGDAGGQGETDKSAVAGTHSRAQCMDVAERKYFTTLAAHAASEGRTQHELRSGRLQLCRWGRAQELHDLRAVSNLLRQIGVRT